MICGLQEFPINQVHGTLSYQYKWIKTFHSFARFINAQSWFNANRLCYSSAGFPIPIHMLRGSQFTCMWVLTLSSQNICVIYAAVLFVLVYLKDSNMNMHEFCPSAVDHYGGGSMLLNWNTGCITIQLTSTCSADKGVRSFLVWHWVMRNTHRCSNLLLSLNVWPWNGRTSSIGYCFW